jgi:phosphoribosyl-AMP cyclohydrolase
MTLSPRFSPQGTPQDVENGLIFMPKFDASGLITAVTVDAVTHDILMVAHMNAEALAKTLETGQAWYWSRSRQALWLKGETSGQLQTVKEIRIDCDQDCLLLRVEVSGDGGCCHTGRPQCFYRRVDGVVDDGSVKLTFV